MNINFPNPLRILVRDSESTTKIKRVPKSQTISITAPIPILPVSPRGDIDSWLGTGSYSSRFICDAH
ncbi:hypothetical protein RJT34_19261 [Clitoria ternatea]|uniref:Uncharacterized protein n=1 Tax=Clitoria ternatea TaxID=43366 RepID=A0AAN9IQP5_CLITE